MNGRLKVTLVAITAALAMLVVAAGAPADSPAACMGERATIVGTDGDDLIAGTDAAASRRLCFSFSAGASTKR